MANRNPALPIETLLGHAQFVRAVARGVLRSEDLVDDAVQETWLAALKSPGRRGGSLRAWLAGIARRRALDIRRRETRRQKRDERAARREAEPSTARLAEKVNTGRWLAEGVMQLKEPYRGAILLRYYEGLSPQEVARHQGVPHETARTRLKQGLKLLRRDLLPSDARGREKRLGALVLLAEAPVATGVISGGIGALIMNKLTLTALVVGALLGAWWILDGNAKDLSAELGSSAANGLESELGSDVSPTARAPRPPVLFGRPWSERTGAGDVVGRVLYLADASPAVGARVLLSGESYAGEAISAKVQTGKDGRFLFHRAPSSPNLSITVADPSKPAYTRTVTLAAFEPEALLDTGTVWLGHKGDLHGVVVDTKGRALAGAHVEIHRSARQSGLGDMDMPKLLRGLDHDPVPLARTATDAEGAFTLAELAPGPVTVVARAAGHVVGLQEMVFSAEAEAAPLRLVLAATEIVRGRVVDGQGAPIRGARVAFLGSQKSVGLMLDVDSALTNADGRFEIDSPPAGGSRHLVAGAPGYVTYWTEVEPDGGDVEVVLEGGSTINLLLKEAVSGKAVGGARLTFLMSRDDRLTDSMFLAAVRTDSSGRVRFAARPGAFVMIFIAHAAFGDIVYMPAMGGPLTPQAASGLGKGVIEAGLNQVTIELATAFRIEGRITDSNGQGIEGARCKLLGGLFSGGTEKLSDAEGRYHLFAHPSTPVSVRVTTPTHFQDPATLRDSITAQAGQVVTRDIVLKPAASVAGRIVDHAGRPLAGARVRVHAPVPGGYNQLLDTAETISGTDGRFVVDGVRPTEGLRVLVRRAGHVGITGPTFHIAGATVKRVGDLVLPKGTMIRVTARDEGGRALAGTVVRLAIHRTDQVAWSLYDGLGQVETVRTDASGKATFAAMPDGFAVLTTAHPAFAQQRRSFRIDEDAEPETQVEVALERGRTVSGRVRRADGRPLDGATLMLRATTEKPSDEDWTPNLVVKTDKQGQFAIEHAPAIALRLQASRRGYLQHTLDVGGRSEGLEVTLQPKQKPTHRLAELQAAHKELTQRIQATEDEDEKKRLQQQAYRLLRQIQEALEAEGND